MDRSRSRSGACLFSSVVPLLLLHDAISTVSTLQEVGTTPADGQQSFLQHPLRGNISCSSVCPPQKLRENDIIFCRDNCPDYWSWMISAIFSDSSGLVNQASECTDYNFTHVPSGNVILCSTFRNLTNASENAKRFWSVNCIAYFVCMIRKHTDVVLSGRNVSSTTILPPSDPSYTFSSEQATTEASLLPLYIIPIVLCIILCGGLVGLIIYGTRWKSQKPRQRVEDNADQPLNVLPVGLRDDNVPFPVEEVGNGSLPSQASLTALKETCFSRSPDSSC